MKHQMHIIVHRVQYMYMWYLQILLDSCQLLKLSDFTLAKMTDDSQNNFDFKSIVQSMLVPRETTDHPLNSGYAPSPFYAAPELYEGGQFSPATDLWSLGCVVYELSLGEYVHNVY